MRGTTRARPTAGSGTSPASIGWRRGWREGDARVPSLSASGGAASCARHRDRPAARSGLPRAARVIPSPESSDLWLRRSGRMAVEGEAGASHRSRLSEAGIRRRELSRRLTRAGGSAPWNRGAPASALGHAPQSPGDRAVDQKERQVIDDLFGKIRQVAAQSPQRDAEAEAYIARQAAAGPGAPHYIAQALLVQEQALASAQSRIQQLEQQAASPQRQSGGGGGVPAGPVGGGAQ